MGAIRMLSANDLRRRWVSTLAIALLIGFVGAIVLAAVSGARRSDSALRRFNDESRSATVEVDAGLPSAQQLRAFEIAIGSPPIGLVRAYGISPAERTSVATGVDVDGSFGSAVDRARVINGRLSDPNAPDEATISESLSEQTGIGVGDTFSIASVTPTQLAQGDFSPKGPKPRIHVVGIVRRPSDLSDLAASGGRVTLTPAFDRTYNGRIALFTLVLEIRTNDVAHVTDVARRMFGSNESFQVIDLRGLNNGAQSAINVLTVALWIFAAVAAGAGLFAVGVVMFREIAQGRPEQPTLRAVGLARRQRVGASSVRAIPIAVGGSLVATVGAIALSPLFPFGIARRADPDPGLHADWRALAPGAAAILVFVLGVALLAAIRATRVDPATVRYRRTRSIADVLAVSRLSPVASNGIRMAFDPGRDERAVPLRSAFVGAVLGVLGVAAVIVFAASLSNLAGTPRLFGWTWDVKFREPEPTRCARDAFTVDQQAGVSDIAGLCYTPLDIDGRNTVVWGFTPIRGSIEPTIVAGRPPNADDEISLGRDAMNALHKRLGDVVRVGEGTTARDYVIVGQTVFPTITYGDVQHLADGATVTGGGFTRVSPKVDPNGNVTRYVLARIAPAARPQAEKNVAAYLINDRHADPSLASDAIGGPTRPAEIDRLQHTSWFLPALGMMLVVLAVTALAHAFITATRRRRYELAVLKALGFDRGEVRGMLAWEATTLAVVGVGVGLPIGVLVGRLAWTLVAHSIGVSATIVVPGFALLTLVPATLLLVNTVAFLPARSAARTRTAVALAVE